MNNEPISFNLNEVSDDDDDLESNIIIQLPSEKIEIDFYQLQKWSKIARKCPKEKIKLLATNIQKYQQQYHIKAGNIKTFFKNISDEQVQITIDQYCDHLKLSKLLDVTKYGRVLQKFSQNHHDDIAFIIKLLQEQNSLPNMEKLIGQISPDMENLLSNNLNQCLQNQDFFNLPTIQIARIIKKSQKQIPSNLLYTFIKESLDSKYALLSFLQIKDLSEENFNDLCNYFLNKGDETTERYTQFLKYDFSYLKELREKVKTLTKQDEQNNLEKNQLNEAIEKLTRDKESMTEKLTNEINKLNDKNAELTNNIKNLTDKNKELTDDVRNLTVKNKLKNNIKYLTDKNKELTNDVSNLTVKNKELTDDVSNLTVKNNELKNKINKLNDKNEKLINDIKNLTVINKELTRTNNKLTDKNKELNDEVDRFKTLNKAFQLKKKTPPPPSPPVAQYPKPEQKQPIIIESKAPNPENLQQETNESASPDQDSTSNQDQLEYGLTDSVCYYCDKQDKLEYKQQRGLK